METQFVYYGNKALNFRYALGVLSYFQYKRVKTENFPNFFFIIFTYEYFLYRHEILPILVYRHAFVGTHTNKQKFEVQKLGIYTCTMYVAKAM